MNIAGMVGPDGRIQDELGELLNCILIETDRRVKEEMEKRGWDSTPEYIREHCGKNHQVDHASSTIYDRFYHDGNLFISVKTTMKTVSEGGKTRMTFDQEYMIFS